MAGRPVAPSRSTGHGRWLSHRVVWLPEVRDGRIIRQTVWNDLAAIRRQLL
jgi:ketosteroid isomerase-like protein